ncbi:MAG: hypothetical protein J0626_08520, partial [Rhodospirillaceae bacterium]|nr:hypothetical protein [Rhodospirillaceae bacterium]
MADLPERSIVTMSSALSASRDFSTIFSRFRDHWSIGLDAVGAMAFVPTAFTAGFLPAVFDFTAVLDFVATLDFTPLDFTGVFLTAAFAPLGADAFFGAAFFVAGLLLLVPDAFVAVFRRTAVFFSEMALILLKPASWDRNHRGIVGSAARGPVS